MPTSPPSAQRHALDVLSPRADVMGRLLDSSDVARTSTQAARDRARAYVEALGDAVDIWEIGNEINGEWLGARATPEPGSAG